MRIFKNRSFARFASKADIDDGALCEAVQLIERGLISADLGGGIFKQRIARPGQGKSGGFRVLVILKQGATAYFVHGFAKNEKDNISKDELMALRKLATQLMAYNAQAIIQAVASGTLIEVICEEEKVS